MNTILTKITQGVNLNKERTPYIYAVALMGLFTFLFLGAEYLFVDVLSHIVSEDRTVLAQNYDTAGRLCCRAASAHRSRGDGGQRRRWRCRDNCRAVRP